MKIGIIGAGNIGSTLTRRLTALGHSVKVSNSKGPETLKELATETGATAVDKADAASEVDLLIVMIPEKAITELPKDLLNGLPPHSVVVDTGNYYPGRDGYIAEIAKGTPESLWVEQQLGHNIIKAFNNIHALKLLNAGKPAGTKDRIALPVAGDDPAAKSIVMKLIDELGFDPVDSGSLAESWRQEPGTPVYGTSLDLEATKKALSEAKPDRQNLFRA